MPHLGPEEAGVGIEDWFLTAAERGNPAYTLPDWSTGNAVVAHVHGAAYFSRLVDVVSALEQDDQLYFTDWRGDADERLRPEGPTVGTLFGDAGVNIANMAVSRTRRGGKALMVLSVDSEPEPGLVEHVRAEGFDDARLISL